MGITPDGDYDGTGRFSNYLLHPVPLPENAWGIQARIVKMAAESLERWATTLHGDSGGELSDPFLIDSLCRGALIDFALGRIPVVSR